MGLKYNFNLIRFVALLLFIISIRYSNAYEKPRHIAELVWNKVESHLLPEEHPIKPLLDELFSQSRAILCLETLEKAGFSNPHVREFTHLVVTKHPDFPGYVFKIYMDAQRCFSKRKEYDCWVMRLEGVRLIQDEIARRGWTNKFKTPTKWIYLLPEKPAPPKEFIRKNFILVEEDMDLYDVEQNYKLWGSNLVTEELLTDFYILCEELGLKDCAKPENAPFSKDGRIAFIDTQTTLQWPVRYSKMTPYLSQEMQILWKKLIQ